MPTYEYKCSKCEAPYSEIRGMTESEKRKTCAAKGCNGKLLRVFSAPPISFNSAGFNQRHG